MKLKQGLAFRRVGGEPVLVTPDPMLGGSGGMVILNETGACLCALLEKGTDVEHMTAALTEAYDITAETARESVETFVGRLRDAGLLAP